MLRAALVLPVVLVAACGGSSGETLELGGASALTWGDGSYGVVLAHGASYDAESWEDQAEAIAEQDVTVVAVEDISPAAIEDAVRHLQEDGVEGLALVGGSAGADAILQLSVEQPDLADQLILLSPNVVVDGLGDQPKLFIASEDEPRADVPQQIADGAPGEENEVVLLPGSAHAQGVFDSDQGDRAMELILDRLEEHGTS